MRDYYVVYDMSPLDSGEADYIQVGIAYQKKGEPFGDEHYNSTSDQVDNLREAFIGTDMSYHISYKEANDPDTPDEGDDTTGDGTGDGTTILPANDDQSDEMEKFMQDNKVLVIVGGSAAVFLIISLLTCCCCCGKGKNRKDTYIYRTYSQLKGSNDHVQALDEEDTPGPNENGIQ